MSKKATPTEFRIVIDHKLPPSVVKKIELAIRRAVMLELADADQTSFGVAPLDTLPATRAIGSSGIGHTAGMWIVERDLEV